LYPLRIAGYINKYTYELPVIQYSIYYITVGTPAETGNRNLLPNMISAFCCGVNYIFILLGCYAA
jgi:hypothetical protein